MSYFQIPPGFSTSDCFTPIYAIAGSLLVYQIAKFAFREIRSLINR